MFKLGERHSLYFLLLTAMRPGTTDLTEPGLIGEICLRIVVDNGTHAGLIQIVREVYFGAISRYKP